MKHVFLCLIVCTLLVCACDPVYFEPDTAVYLDPDAYPAPAEADGDSVRVTFGTDGIEVITSSDSVSETEDGCEITGAGIIDCSGGGALTFRRLDLSVGTDGHAHGWADIPEFDGGIFDLFGFSWSAVPYCEVETMTGEEIMLEFESEIPVLAEREYLVYDVGEYDLTLTGYDDSMLTMPEYPQLPAGGAVCIVDPQDPGLYMGYSSDGLRQVDQSEGLFTKSMIQMYGPSSLSFVDGKGLGLSGQGLIPLTMEQTDGLEEYGLPSEVAGNIWFKGKIPLKVYGVPLELDGKGVVLFHTGETAEFQLADGGLFVGLNGSLNLSVDLEDLVPLFAVNSLVDGSVWYYDIPTAARSVAADSSTTADQPSDSGFFDLLEDSIEEGIAQITSTLAGDESFDGPGRHVFYSFSPDPETETGLDRILDLSRIGEAIGIQDAAVLSREIAEDLVSPRENTEGTLSGFFRWVDSDFSYRLVGVGTYDLMPFAVYAGVEEFAHSVGMKAGIPAQGTLAVTENSFSFSGEGAGNLSLGDVLMLRDCGAVDISFQSDGTWEISIEAGVECFGYEFGDCMVRLDGEEIGIEGASISLPLLGSADLSGKISWSGRSPEFTGEAVLTVDRWIGSRYMRAKCEEIVMGISLSGHGMDASLGAEGEYEIGVYDGDWTLPRTEIDAGQETYSREVFDVAGVGSVALSLDSGEVELTVSSDVFGLIDYAAMLADMDVPDWLKDFFPDSVVYEIENDWIVTEYIDVDGNLALGYKTPNAILDSAGELVGLSIDTAGNLITNPLELSGILDEGGDVLDYVSSGDIVNDVGSWF
jgi:hypothetical protein